VFNLNLFEDEFDFSRCIQIPLFDDDLMKYYTLSGELFAWSWLNNQDEIYYIHTHKLPTTDEILEHIYNADD
jgi:hypothetical protein